MVTKICRRVKASLTCLGSPDGIGGQVEIRISKCFDQLTNLSEIERQYQMIKFHLRIPALFAVD